MLENVDINEGKIKCSIKEGINFLKKLDLYKENVPKNCEILDYTKKYSQDYRSSVYQKQYEDVYKIAVENMDYDIILMDGSFFQFNFEKKGKRFLKIKYNFYQNPYIDATTSYENFIEEIYSEKYESVGEKYREFYEQYIAESKVNQEITPIRYDFDFEEYKEMCHPISHLHVGRNGEVRFPVDYIILPEMFIQNVVMLIYTKKWKNVITDVDIRNICFSGKRKSIECYDEDILNTDEKKIIYIN